MKEIKSREELKEALRKPKSVVIFGKQDCMHCTIVKNCIESIERHFPLIDFYYTEAREFAESRHIEAFPVIAFYENGTIQGTLHGSGKITLIKNMLNMWFLKD